MLQNLFRNLPGVTKNLLLINVVMFVLAMAFPNVNGMLSLHYFESPLFEPYQIVTHFFMHASLGHIFFNMFALVMFGAQLEKIWGPQRFLFFYLFSAIGAFLLHMGVVWYELSDVPIDVIEFLKTEGAEVISGGQNYVDSYIGGLNAKFNGSMVGASGAIMGLLAAFAFIFPNTELMLIFLPIPIKAKYFVPFYMLVELFLGVNNFQWDNIAHFAHLGGALFGIILVLIWRKDRTKFY
jgi:membrane associated rhomboid family serine protease